MSYKSGRVFSGNVLLIGLSILALLFFYGGNAGAFESFFTGAGNCSACHPASPTTCAGCHAHGVHSSSAKSDINLSATTDKATYSPGETVSVSFTGGYRAGWVRAYLYDNTGAMVDNTSAGTNGLGNVDEFPGPINLTGTAPATAGTYTFTAAWYGNRYDLSQEGGTTTFGPNWTPDPNNANHGQEKIATNSFTVTAGADATAPKVSSTIPDNNATGVAVGSVVTATFSEPINPATVTTTSFLLRAGVDNVTGTVSLNPAHTTATFTPSATLQNNTVYTATLTTAITDNAANPLAADYVWTFTASAVADTTAPTVSSTIPDNNATGVAIGSVVTATFSEPINPATVTTTSFLLRAGVDNVTGTVSLNPAQTTVTFTPSAPLQDNTVYTATLTTAITDTSGNPLAADDVWTFTTGAAVVPTPSGDDDGWFGCAISPSGGGNGGILGTYGFLLLLALGIALRRRVRRRKEEPAHPA